MKIIGTDKAKSYRPPILARQHGIEEVDAAMLKYGGLVEVDDDTGQQLIDAGVARTVTVAVNTKKDIKKGGKE